MKRPDLYDVWLALREGQCYTSTVRHRLISKYDFRSNLQHDAVMRRLKQLERIGKVHRVKSFNQRDIVWVAIEGWPPASATEAAGGDATGGFVHEGAVGRQPETPSPLPNPPDPEALAKADKEA